MPTLLELINRLRDRLNREALTKELDEELRFHRQMIERDVGAHAAGDAAQASRALARQLGNVTYHREEGRLMWSLGWIEAAAQDTRYALRGMRTRPLFTLVVAFTMAVGIGANATMFGLLDRLLFRAPAHVDHPDRVLQLETQVTGTEAASSIFSYATYQAIRKQSDAFEEMAVATQASIGSRRFFPLGKGVTASRVSGALVSGNFFATLGVKPERGRFFLPDDDDVDHPRLIAVISHGFWQRYFAGKPDVVGKSIDIGAHRYIVVGVAPAGFMGIELYDIDVWLPVTAPSGLRFDNSPGWAQDHGLQWLGVVGRLKPGVSPQVGAAQATAAIRAVARERIAKDPSLAAVLSPDSLRVLLVSLTPGKVPRGASAQVETQDMEVSKLLGGLSLVVLIIACANVANLLLVRGFRRRREIAVRLALGSSRRRLIGQLLIEGVLLSMLGGVGALLMTHWSSGLLRRMLFGAGAWTDEAVDGRVLFFTFAVTVLTGVVTAIVPALQSSRDGLVHSLKSGVREGGGHRSRLRTGLLALQTALALVLLACAGLFIQSMRKVNDLPFGIDVDHILVADISHQSAGLTNEDATRLYRQFVERAPTVPGVKAAAMSIGLPFGLRWPTEVYLPGRAMSTARDSVPTHYAISPDYFAAMGIPVLRGRAFTAGDRAATAPVVAINDAVARTYWPNQNPIGQCMKIGADTMPCSTVVAVVGNTRRNSLVERPTLQIYRPLDQLPQGDVNEMVGFFSYTFVARTSGDAARFVEPIRRMMQSTAPTVPYANVRTMTDVLGSRTRAWRLGASMFSAFGAIALVLAVVGLYSVLAFGVAQRTQEFGVRVALGAQSTDLLRLTLVSGLTPVLGGIGAGVAVALLGGKLVSALLFDVSPRDPVVLASVSALFLLAATIASLVPAWRATRVDSVSALRAE